MKVPTACQLLLLSEDARTLAGQACGRAGLLTISNMPGFAQSGGMTGFFRKATESALRSTCAEPGPQA
ncbi:MAG: hypothetical protein ABL878_18430 [Burkholderiales bacterium]